MKHYILIFFSKVRAILIRKSEMLYLPKNVFIVGFFIWALASTLAVILVCVKKACLKRCQSCETRATPTPSAPPDPNTSQVPLMDMFTPQPLVTPPLVWTSLPTLPTPQSDTTLKAEGF